MLGPNHRARGFGDTSGGERTGEKLGSHSASHSVDAC